MIDRPLRIVQIVGSIEGGGTQIAAALATQLDTRRFSSTLVSPDADQLADVCARAGTTFRPVALLSSRTSRSVVAQLRIVLEEIRPDVVHVHGTRAGWFTRRALPAALRAPIIYSEHSFAFDARRGVSVPFWLGIERTLCRWADQVTTSCHTHAQRLIQHGWVRPDRLRIDHYGIAPDQVRVQASEPITREALGIDGQAPIVGALGRLIEQKGFGYLVGAAPQIVHAYPEAVFIVVGDGEQRAALEERCRELGVAQSFRFLGAREHPWRWLAHCDVIALPSLWEGLPLVALEALALGRPIVATPVGGTPEVVVPGRTGILVPPRDTQALSDAIVSLLGDPERRSAMGAAGKQLVTRYDWRDTLAAFMSLYDELYTKPVTSTWPTAIDNTTADRVALTPRQRDVAGERDGLHPAPAEEGSDG